MQKSSTCEGETDKRFDILDGRIVGQDLRNHLVRRLIVETERRQRENGVAQHGRLRVIRTAAARRGGESLDRVDLVLELDAYLLGSYAEAFLRCCP